MANRMDDAKGLEAVCNSPSANYKQVSRTANTYNIKLTTSNWQLQTKKATATGRGDDAVGNPHRAEIDKLKLFELVLFLKVDRQFSIERFEPTATHSTVSSAPS